MGRSFEMEDLGLFGLGSEGRMEGGRKNPQRIYFMAKETFVHQTETEFLHRAVIRCNKFNQCSFHFQLCSLKLFRIQLWFCASSALIRNH